MGLMNFDDLLKNALNDQKDPPMELNDKLRKKLSDMPQKNAKKRNR